MYHQNGRSIALQIRASDYSLPTDRCVLVTLSNLWPDPLLGSVKPRSEKTETGHHFKGPALSVWGFTALMDGQKLGILFQGKPTPVVNLYPMEKTIMSRIAIPHNSKFDSLRAMELANLVQRAYEQYNYYKWSNSQSPKVTKCWDQEQQVTGSTTCDPVRGVDYGSVLDPSEKGKVVYDFLASFQYTEFKIFERITSRFFVSETVPFGFIARREIENGIPGIFIVIRGTLTGAEWFDNFQFSQVPFLGNANQGNHLGLVSKGFNRIYTRSDAKHPSLKDPIEKVLRDPTKCPPNSQVFITGHSLGGALTTLAAAHIAARICPEIGLKKPIVYTYASPRVGDPVFAGYLKGTECYRIANSEDLVPAVPPATGRLKGPEMDNKPIPDLDDEQALQDLYLSGDKHTGQDASLARKRNTDNLRKLAFTFAFRRKLSQQVYQHVGEPLYFTGQLSYISTNHNMFDVYREVIPRD